MISCLTVTHGRFTQLCQAAACWAWQDYQDREWVILNTHPQPLTTTMPGVRILNEPWHHDLGAGRTRVLEEAWGEFCCTWDDDDFWFPWHLSQAMARIGDADGWKPSRSWFLHGANGYLKAEGNVFEASILFRTSAVRRVGYRVGQGDEHCPLMASLRVVDEEVGEARLSYVYTWGFGRHHASGSLGSRKPLADRVAEWKAAHQNTGDGAPVEPSDVDFLLALREDAVARAAPTPPDLIYLSSQPTTDFYAWQLAAMLRSFQHQGIPMEQVHVIGIRERCVPRSWRDVMRTYPGVQWHWYRDERQGTFYIPSKQPWVYAQHWRAHTEMRDARVFLHDSDIILTDCPRWNALAGPVWHLSDTRGYLGTEYLRSKGYGVLEGMCEAIGVPLEIVEDNDAGAGGAQYILQDVDADFWEKVAADAETLYAWMRRRNREIKTEPDLPKDYLEVQVWTAGMWALLWNAWVAGHQTRIAPELDFAWSTDTSERLAQVAILHNAGVTEQHRGKLFFKGDYMTQSPYGITNDVDPKYASHRYLEEVKAAGAELVTGARPCGH